MARRAAILALVATALCGPAAAPAGAASLKAELDRVVRGTSTAVHVAVARGGRTVYARRSAGVRPLASTTKLLTARAALTRFGAARRFETTVLATGPLEPDGTVRGDLVLRGDGDPDFGTAAATALADAVARGGVRRITGAVVADESLFDAVRGGPATNGAFDAELGAPLSALSYDRGRETPEGPVRGDALDVAARRFDDLLEARGVVLPQRPRTGPSPPGATRLAAVPSATVAELTRRMLVESDDFLAEMLTKRLAAETGVVGSTTAGAQLVARPGTSLVDGSGLDRRDTGTPRGLTRALRELRAIDGHPLLARAGQGTLRGRLPGLASRCRAKTGTLAGVGNLAGFCTTRRGRTVVFAVLGRSPRLADRLVARLVRRG